ncbi:UNVERIFIED_CONTAM: hypothetical protein Slati_2399300 [Sesamum latifolium]|uniref:Integrase catalytic domain-containing protein n=1 Tax=Sesamum latifolium TaxID=2727402 RepID=A0AAW2WC23_9LAMI
MGNGHSRKTSSDAKTTRIFDSCSRLLLQVGGGRGVKQNSEKEVIRFIRKNIICEFGIPRAFVMDNSTQFTGVILQQWCKELKIG